MLRDDDEAVGGEGHEDESDLVHAQVLAAGGHEHHDVGGHGGNAGGGYSRLTVTERREGPAFGVEGTSAAEPQRSLRK